MGPELQSSNAPAPPQKDGLLEALSYITGFFGHPRSPSALQAGIAGGTSGLTLREFCQAADRAGFKARIARPALGQVAAEIMPVIAVMKDKSALVLLERNDKDHCRAWNPGSGMEKILPLAEINKAYSGYCIYIKPHRHDGGLAAHWFWGTILENRGIYAQICVSALLINVFALTSPIFTMNFYDRVLPNNAVETGWVLVIGAGSIYIFDFIIRSLRGYFIDTAGRRADIIVAQKLFGQVLDMRLSEHHGSTGAFANNLKEFDSLREFFNSATLTGLVDFPFSLLFLAAIWLIAGAKLALLLLAFYALVAGTGYLLQLPVQKKVRRALKTGEQQHGLLVETLGNLEMIKGVGGEGQIRGRYAHYTSQASESGQASRFYSGLSVNFSICIQQLSGVILMLVGMYMVEAKELTVGALMACIILSSRAIAPIGMVNSLVNRYYQAKSAYRNLDGIMQAEVERPRDKKFLHRPLLKGHFQFKNAGFSYARTHTPVLQNINLEIQPGEKVAIVGRIGSGKSTLVKLMVNFFEPAEGTLLIDETDMRQIDPADLRRNVSFMGQDTSLMSGTVRDNIVMGRPQATDEEVLKIAELIGVHDFIRRHPLGYDAPVGERGAGLSGGQRQSVALARTLLMDTNVLILDEPTNAMDSMSEDMILKNLEQFVADKTFVLVTHKPALLKLITRLVVMDGGRVVMDGPRDQVLQALNAGKIVVPKGAA